ncbi:MAG: response regulator, partial [Lachnospiraceae bacterium]|nr:response regulator [Lachnospiraceae bacterium]
MGNQLVWQERFNIGVDVIDKEHKKLFNVLNKLFAYGKEEEKSQWVCQEAIKYFRDHSIQHFSEEEEYMESIDYAGLETHRHIHNNFREKTLPLLESELIRTGYAMEAVDHFLGVCAGWLIGHTLIEDHAITGKAVSKWTGLLPDEQQAAMKTTIMQLLYDMFRLKPRVVSDCYGGEKFGNGIYYRLIYATKNNEKWEITLIFEEKLIVSTLGGIMDTQSKAVNAMLMNAARYTARQFVENIRQHLPFADLDEVVDEQLLTYEQFERIFDKQNPQVSLLFDTGAGYFAYCFTAPHLLRGDGGVGIQAENAMAEVQKYLKLNQLGKKKKILVVDDSEFVLRAMEELLGKDYEVMMAKSGLASIRSITLNRPDLVLLDYEMPVCDGSQVLEMIRSEEDFANIPVIFLTSRVDKESIK